MSRGPVDRDGSGASHGRSTHFSASSLLAIPSLYLAAGGGGGATEARKSNEKGTPMGPVLSHAQGLGCCIGRASGWEAGHASEGGNGKSDVAINWQIVL